MTSESAEKAGRTVGALDIPLCAFEGLEDAPFISHALSILSVHSVC